MTVLSAELTQQLEELIVALDQRVPRTERAGEAAIASASAELRAKAVARLAASPAIGRTADVRRSKLIQQACADQD